MSADELQVAEVFDSGAWCWFADPRAIRHYNADSGSEKIWIGCIDNEGTVKAMQLDLSSGLQREVVLDRGFQPDDHNNPSFLVLPDNRVMIFWSEHTSEPRYYYRVSIRPDDITVLSERKTVSVEGFGNYTYPSPFYLSDSPNSFYLLWRGVRWHPTIARYSLPDKEGNIQMEMAPKQIVQSTGARPYAKYDSNGKDRIYIAYTLGHPDNEMPNWLFYSQLDINTLNLFDASDAYLANVTKKPYPVSKEHSRGPLIADAPRNVKNWVWDLAHDAKGYPVIAQIRLSPDARKHVYCYSRWDGRAWSTIELADAGGWFHQNPNGAEKCYSGGLVLDSDEPSDVYVSLPTEGQFGKVYEIWRARVSIDGKVSPEQLTFNSKKNNIRPYMIPGNGRGVAKYLSWMNGDYYYWIRNASNPLGFPTRILVQKMN